MEHWSAPESIFAPLIAAVPPRCHWVGFGEALRMVSRRIPHSTWTTHVRKTGLSPTHPETWKRTVRWSTEPAPFSEELFLCEYRGDDTLVDVYWKLGLTHLKDGLLTPAVPAEYDSAILQVSEFQILGQSVEGAPQLALVRHLWAEEVTAAAPDDAIVFGGQHHWRDKWWTEKVGAGAAQ